MSLNDAAESIKLSARYSNLLLLLFLLLLLLFLTMGDVQQEQLDTSGMSFCKHGNTSISFVIFENGSGTQGKKCHWLLAYPRLGQESSKYDERLIFVFLST